MRDSVAWDRERSERKSERKSEKKHESYAIIRPL